MNMGLLHRGYKKRSFSLFEETEMHEEYLQQFDLSYFDQVFEFIQNNYNREESLLLDIGFYIDVSSSMFVESVNSTEPTLYELIRGQLAKPNVVLAELLNRFKHFKHAKIKFIPFVEEVFEPLNVETELFAKEEGVANVERVQTHIKNNNRDCINVIITDSDVAIDKSKTGCEKVVYVLGPTPKIDDLSISELDCKVIRVASIIGERWSRAMLSE